MVRNVVSVHRGRQSRGMAKLASLCAALLALNVAFCVSSALSAEPTKSDKSQNEASPKKAQEQKPAAQKRKTLPAHPLAMIPFEDQRASERRDRVFVHINQDVTQVPGHRVEHLPVVNGKMGEHAHLAGDVEIYFPYGRILRATTQLEKYKQASTGDTPALMNPRYNYVNMFDSALGPVCAAGEAPGSGSLTKSRTEIRINRENAISFVRTVAPTVAGPTADKSEAYKVVTALDIRIIAADEPAADQLYRTCLSNGKKSAAAGRN